MKLTVELFGNMILIPAILSKNIDEAKEKISNVIKDGNFSRIQIDFIDGEFSNNTTFYPEDLVVSSYFNLKFDAHLMVTEKNVSNWADMAKISGYDRVVVQLESISNPENFKGLGLDVHSPVEAIEPYLEKLEVVVVMSVEPGFGGQKFNSEIINKVESLSEIRKNNNYNFKICIDGGVQKNMLGILQIAGADEVAVGVDRLLSDF